MLLSKELEITRSRANPCKQLVLINQYKANIAECYVTIQFNGNSVPNMLARLIITNLFLHIAFCKECYWNSCPYVLFGGKTLYDDVRGDIRDITDLKGCVPTSVWILARHGTRNPSSYDVRHMMETAKLKEEILNCYYKGRGQMCAEDISNLYNWKWNETMSSEPDCLVNKGYNELRQLGNRIKEKFTNLLENVKHYQIRPTNQQRTIESAKAFTQGLKNFTFNITDPVEKDVILTPYKYCSKYLKEVWDGTRTQMEMNRYYETEEFKQLQTNMKTRTNLTELSINNIISLYDLCRFYRGYSESNMSPWCALFTNDELPLLEYSKDLQHYYRNGYGNAINPKLGELVLKDLYQSFNNTIQTNDRSFTAYFSHDSLIEMVYSALGLFQDHPRLTGSVRVKDRKWRTSLHTPFAANIIVVLNRCSTETEALVNQKYRVQFFINEIEFQLCDNKTCDWKSFENKLKPFLNSSLDFCGTT
ncbi:multiple inositol polyphosphate phosphatase 1-like [Galleria mellonella]|uniref:Multiple inositol polyphosphate phosphatase 1 n=1 Tax=Galleria mellonella TaxID=7137 RepID=A0ABM3N3N0_GALME|nr:multiple inositol polyphosphate phosphatase 1-like [Galleria mellonella]